MTASSSACSIVMAELTECHPAGTGLVSFLVLGTKHSLAPILNCYKMDR